MVILKKRAFDVEIPQINFVTSILAMSEDEIVGRTLKIDLTRFLKGRSLEAKLLIAKEDSKLIGKFYSLALFMSYIKQMMRTGISYVEDSFFCFSKDNSKFRVKPFLITRKKVHRSVRDALRQKCREEIISYFKGKTSDEIFYEVLTSRFQHELQRKLKKIYPLSLCEIRVLEKERKA